MQVDDNDKTCFEGEAQSMAISQPPGETVHVALDKSLRSPGYIAQQASLEDYTLGLNPLVNCASHLLLEMVYLRTPGAGGLDSQGGKRPAGEKGLEDLRRRLVAEIRGFENVALGCEIDHAQVLAAKYVLCSALDESVSTSPLGAGGDWSTQALLSTFHNETWGGEKFFQITERCMQQPARNLYLLELIYLLLSLGFEGRYKLQSRGPIELELLRERIYRQVRMLRGEPDQDLCKKVPEGKYKNKIYTYVPISLLITFVISCLAVSYLGFAHVLANRAEPILHQFAVHAGESAGGDR
ncbi:type IVB secretion system protein IcmH/DotU [Desulfomicrobium salsuginis]